MRQVTLNHFLNCRLSFCSPQIISIHLCNIWDFLSKICPKKSIRLQSSFIDTLVADNRHSISAIYTPLNAKFSKPLQNTSMASWIKDLPGHLDVWDIVRGYSLTRAITQCESLRETQFKIIHRAYYPFSTARSPDIGPASPWCLINKPTLLHRLWTCPPIVVFWTAVTRFITRVTHFSLETEPKLLLFGCPPHIEPYSFAYNLLPRSTRHWILLALLMARRTILQHLITSSPPSLSAAIKGLKSLLYKENLDLFSSFPQSKTKFEQKWSAFIKSSLSTSEQQSLISNAFIFLDSDHMGGSLPNA